VVLVPADAASALEVLEFHLDKKTNLYVAVAQWFEQRFRRNSAATVTVQLLHFLELTL
jgi:PIN domain nuclease of toxin-antitoxin system